MKQNYNQNLKNEYNYRLINIVQVHRGIESKKNPFWVCLLENSSRITLQ